MNSKTILKRTMPIIIALLLVIVIGAVAVVATKEKKNPVVSDSDASYVTYKNGDVTFEVSREKVYDTLTSSSAISTTVSEMLDIIDEKLLSNAKNASGKSYLEAVDPSDVYDKVAKSIFSYTLNDYVENNEDTFVAAAKKAGQTFDEYLKDKLEELVQDYVDSFELTYGLKAEVSNFTYLEGGEFVKNADDEYVFTVDQTCDAYNYYKLEVARVDYSRDQLEADYKESLAEYSEYLAKSDAYEEYVDDFADWKDSDDKYEDAVITKKADRKKFEKSSYYHGPYYNGEDVVEAPEEVEAPVLVESDFEDAYEEENYNKYWAVIVPYDSTDAATIALLQNGIYVSVNGAGTATWFHYGVKDDSEELADYTTYGENATNVIIDSSYYKSLYTKNDDGDYVTEYTSANPATTGAYELSQEEICEAIVKLYNQFYQANSDKQLVLGEDYTVAEGVYTFNCTDKLEYSQTELTSLGVYSSASTNKFNKYDEETPENNTFANTYMFASSQYVYIIAGKKTVSEWDDVVEEASDDYTKTAFYTEKLAELLDDENTTTYQKQYMAELREDAELLIYDTRLEDSYISTYDSDFETTKKKSKTAVASFKVNGEKVEITVDELFNVLAIKLGALTIIDAYQVDWVFNEATIVDKDGNTVLANKYIDYEGYKNKKNAKVANFLKDKKDEETQELLEEAETMVENVKNNFASGSYEESGYPSNYGWNNFLKDYLSSQYNFTIEDSEDLKLLYFYQTIVDEYYEYLATIDEEKWTNVYLVSMAETLSNYINCSGMHVIISYKDADDNAINPIYWTAEQVKNAKDLYDDILGLIKVLPTTEISTELNNLVEAFENAPLNVDGTQPNLDYEVKTVEGETYTYKYFDYSYNYNKNKTYSINVANYKSAGLDIEYQTYDLTADSVSSTVEEFTNNVKQIWDSQWTELLEGEAVTDYVVYDHSFKPQEYKSYGEDLAAEVGSNYTDANGYFATQYGYHVYVNTSSSLEDFFMDDPTDHSSASDKEQVFIGFPEREYALLFCYANEHAGEEDYVDFSDLYEDYVDALEDGDATEEKQAIIDAMKSELNYTVSDWDAFYTKFAMYYDEYTEDYVAAQLSTWFGTYSDSTYTLVHYDFTNSYYRQLNFLKQIKNNIASFNLSANDLAKFENVLEYYIDSYTDALTYISFTRGNKDDVEELLDSILFLSDFYIYTSNLDNIFNSVSVNEKETMSTAFAKLKEIAVNLVSNLTEEERAELADKFSNILPLTK